jgi:hypothetical protein
VGKRKWWQADMRGSGISVGAHPRQQWLTKA